jgi:hypothetical protein
MITKSSNYDSRIRGDILLEGEIHEEPIIYPKPHNAHRDLLIEKSIEEWLREGEENGTQGTR